MRAATLFSGFGLRAAIAGLALLTLSAPAGRAQTTYYFFGNPTGLWDDPRGWYTFVGGVQTEANTPPPTANAVVAAVDATFAPGATTIASLEVTNGRFHGDGHWDVHGSTLVATGPNSVIRGLTIGGGLELRNEGTMRLDYDGNGNGNLGSGDTFRFRNAATGTLSIGTLADSARVISMGYYAGVFANEGILNVDTLATSSVYFQNSYAYYGGAQTNSGTINKTGAGVLKFDNLVQGEAGKTNVTAGTLRAYAGDLAGQINVSSGALFDLSGGAALRTGLDVNGPGTFAISGGSIIPHGASTFDNLTFSGGELYNEAAAATVTVGNLTLSGGNIGSNYTLVTVIATGDGTVTANTRLDSNYTTQAPVLRNTGTLTWSGGDIGALNRMYLENSAGGTFIAEVGASASRTINGGYYGGWVHNLGTFRKTGEGTAVLSAYYWDESATQVQAGTLSFQGGGEARGTFAISSGAVAQLAGGSFTLKNGFASSGAGTFEVTNGSLLLEAGTSSLANLRVKGGQVGYNETAAATLTVGNLSLEGGALGSGENRAGIVATGNSTATGTVTLYGVGSNTTPTLTNSGTLTWSGGNIFGGNVLKLANSSTGTWIASVGLGEIREIGSGYYGGSFTNAGTFTKTGAGEAQLNTYFDTSGTVSVQAGRLRLGGGGEATGSLNIASGATAVLSSGGFTLKNGFAATGAGTFEVSGGALLLQGTSSVANLRVTGGDVGYNETETATLNVGNLTIAGGAMGSGNNRATVSASGSGSAITGTVTLWGTSAHAAPTLANTGTLTWSGGNVFGGNVLKLANSSTGTWIASVGLGEIREIGSGYYGGSFTNAGSFTKTGAGEAQLNTYFDTSGTVSVQAGRLRLGGGGEATGSLNIASGATAVLSSGGFTLKNGFAATGAGTFEVSGGALLLQGTSSVANLRVTGGDVGYNETETATLNVGNLTIAGGAMGSGNNRATVSASGSGSAITGTVTLWGTSAHAAPTLANTGTLTWSGGNIYGGNVLKLTNAASGTWIANVGAGDSREISQGYYGGWFINQGTFRKTGAGTAMIYTSFENAGAIAVEGGRLQFNNGITFAPGSTLMVANGGTFATSSPMAFATLSGTGRVEGDVSVSGTLAPGSSPGLLTIAGSLTLLGTATSAFELAGFTAGTGYDQVAATGALTLDGLLRLYVAPGFASSITSGSTFDLITAGSLGGAYDNVASGTLLADSNGFGTFRVTYDSTTLRLSDWVGNASAIPEPSAYAVLAGCAALALAAWRRRRR